MPAVSCPGSVAHGLVQTGRQRQRPGRDGERHVAGGPSAFELERFLDHGFVGRKGMPDEVLRKRKALARAEIEHFARLLERQPIGVQIAGRRFDDLGVMRLSRWFETARRAQKKWPEPPK